MRIKVKCWEIVSGLSNNLDYRHLYLRRYDFLSFRENEKNIVCPLYESVHIKSNKISNCKNLHKILKVNGSFIVKISEYSIILHIFVIFSFTYNLNTICALQIFLKLFFFQLDSFLYTGM